MYKYKNKSFKLLMPRLPNAKWELYSSLRFVSYLKKKKNSTWSYILRMQNSEIKIYLVRI